MGGKGGGGGGGGTQQQSTQSGTTSSQTNLPPWLDVASQLAVGQALNLSNQPNLFQPYQGQQVADVAPGTQQAYGQIQDPSQTAATTGGAMQALYGAMSPVQAAQQAALQGGINTGQGLLSPYMGGPTTAGQVAGNAQAMMSPYAASVIAPSMQLGQQALAQNLQQIGAQANQAGAYGGTRQGVAEGVAQAQTALGESNLMGNLLNTGWNQALWPASQVGLQAGQQGYGAAGLLGGEAYGAGGTMAQAMQGQLGNALSAVAPYQQQYIGNLSAMGQQQQQQQQAQLNAQMANYYGTQQMPVQNLDLLLSAIGAVPYGTSSTGTTNMQTYGQGIQNLASGNVAGGIIGGASAAGGLLSGVANIWPKISSLFA
jgi:hypothetical protein